MSLRAFPTVAWWEMFCGQLQRGKSYATSLQAGMHEVRVQTSAQKPLNKATKQVTIEAGKDSTVTASWEGQQLVLR